MISFTKILLIIKITSEEDQNITKEVVSVQTKSGPINGFINTYDSKIVNVFLGIPYAEAPIDWNRFRRAEPVRQWSHPLNGNQWPKSCYQIQNDFVGTDDLSEDCLYLNIWSTDLKPGEQSLKPVLVFIHGTALYIGTTNTDLFDGKVLSVLGDVVVVTLNYRLDAFGFLYAGNDDAPGNVGLWDQNLALKWIIDNIEQFGGNPLNITLVGQSAGAWSVSLHLLSSHSQKLFQNAILLSGAAYNHINERTAEEMKKYWIRAVVSIGCGEDQESIDFDEDMMECLKEISPERILQMCTDVDLATPRPAWDRLVVIDGQFLTDKPLNLLQNLKLNQTKNILIGSVEDEGSMLLTSFFDQNKYDWFTPIDMSLAEGHKELVTISTYFMANLQVIGEEVAKLYFNGLNENTDPTEIRYRIGSALADYHLTCPMIRFAEKLFSANKEHVKVYQYMISHAQDIFEFNWTARAYHGSDVGLIFGFPLLSKESTERQKELSKEVIEMLTHFAKYGHPKEQNRLELRPYYLITDNVVKPYYEFSEYPKPNNNLGIGWKVIECDYLWNEYLDN